MPGRSRANVSGCTSVCPTRSPIAKQPKSKRGRWRTAPLRYELDIASGNFDPSPVKYKPQKKESISVSDLFDQFVEYKRRSISIGGLTKYLALQKHVSVFFNNKTTISVSESIAEKFRDWLAEKLEPVTVRERIVLMNACWLCGLKKKLVVENPWADVRVIVAPKQDLQPFTLTEISAIVEKFRSDPYLKHYADMVWNLA